jgi:hypothetical protein
VVICYWDNQPLPTGYDYSRITLLPIKEPSEAECIRPELKVEGYAKKKYGEIPTSWYKQVISQYYTYLFGCDKPFLLKLRSDEKYEKLDVIINKIMENPDKVFCSNIHYQNKDFHMSDHIVGGRTEIFVKTFQTLYREYSGLIPVAKEHQYFGVLPDTQLICAESILAREILKNLNVPINNASYLERIKPIDVNTLGDYIAKWGHRNITWSPENPYK